MAMNELIRAEVTAGSLARYATDLVGAIAIQRGLGGPQSTYMHCALKDLADAAEGIATIKAILEAEIDGAALDMETTR